MNNDQMTITLPSYSEIYGIDSKGQLETFAKYGVVTHPTYLAHVLGAVGGGYPPTCDYVTRTFPDPYRAPSEVVTVDFCGHNQISHIQNLFFGVRPVIKFQDIFQMINLDSAMVNRQGVCEIEYGEYPQEKVGMVISKILDVKYKKGQLKKTGRSYTFNSAYPVSYKSKTSLEEFEQEKIDGPVKLKQYEEYELNGKKYIRVRRIKKTEIITDVDVYDNKYEESYENVWIEVTPITWLLDLNTNSLISKFCLLSGIPMFLSKNKGIENMQSEEYFDKSFMMEFLRQHMLPEIRETLIQDHKKTSGMNL